MVNALDAWRRIPYPMRRKLLDALANPGVLHALAEIYDPPHEDGTRGMAGPEITHDEERDFRTAIAVLEEINV